LFNSIFKVTKDHNAVLVLRVRIEPKSPVWQVVHFEKFPHKETAKTLHFVILYRPAFVCLQVGGSKHVDERKLGVKLRDDYDV